MPARAGPQVGDADEVGCAAIVVLLLFLVERQVNSSGVWRLHVGRGELRTEVRAAVEAVPPVGRTPLIQEGEGTEIVERHAFSPFAFFGKNGYPHEKLIGRLESSRPRPCH